MVQSRGPKGRPRRDGRSRSRPQEPRRPAAQSSRPDPLDPFLLGVIPGAMPGRWIARWSDQRPHQPLEIVPVEVAAQEAALRAGEVDALIARRPLDESGLHVVALYDEVPVVVMHADSHLTAADELRPADLEGEVLITPLDDVLGPLDLPTARPAFAPLETTADAIATAASGVGIVIVPMSLARLHHRKDATYRPLVEGAPASPVVLAWLRERDGEDVQAFVGITRGRTRRSSR